MRRDSGTGRVAETLVFSLLRDLNIALDSVTLAQFEEDPYASGVWKWLPIAAQLQQHAQLAWYKKMKGVKNPMPEEFVGPLCFEICGEEDVCRRILHSTDDRIAEHRRKK
eukprot:3895308-Karenia_brevis.AAC.1